MIVAFSMLIAGIIGITARKSKGGTITAAVFYGIGGFIGIFSSGIFADLKVWGGLSIVFTVIFVISIFVDKRKEAAPVESE